jgi:hypothetical protein
MAIAGYLFRSEQAQRFSRDWAKDLKRLGLPFAHMTDCALGFKHYANLSLEERVQSEKLLISHIKRRTSFGFGVSIDPVHYEQTVGGIPGAPTAYSFCILACMSMVRKWIGKSGYDGKIAYFFEAGHQHASEANRFMNNIANSGELRIDKYRYISHTFIDKREALPLQAADMLVWQFNHFRKRYEEGYTTPRKDYLSLLRPQDISNQYTYDDIERFKHLLLNVGPALSALPPDELEEYV